MQVISSDVVRSGLVPQVIGQDRATDVAVLRIDIPAAAMGKLKVLALGRSDDLLVGQKVYAIGNPFGAQSCFRARVASSRFGGCEQLP